MKLTDLCKGTAHFEECHSGTLYYNVKGFRFGVPVEELQGATVKRNERASVFMKWIRNTLKEVEANENNT